MAKPIQYPTEGGSYTRKPDGALDQVEQTRPAPIAPAAPADEPPAKPATTKE